MHKNTKSRVTLTLKYSSGLYGTEWVGGWEFLRAKLMNELKNVGVFGDFWDVNDEL